MTTTAWTHLPNAVHIDRILAAARANPKRWEAAMDAAGDAGRNAAMDAARDAAFDAARVAAWEAITALIAWDDVAPLLECSPEEVQALAMMGMHAPILMLPAVIALNGE